MITLRCISATKVRRNRHRLGCSYRGRLSASENGYILGTRPSRHLRVQVPFNGLITDACASLDGLPKTTLVKTAVRNKRLCRRRSLSVALGRSRSLSELRPPTSNLSATTNNKTRETQDAPCGEELLRERYRLSTAEAKEEGFAGFADGRPPWGGEEEELVCGGYKTHQAVVW